jgi:hypothetical protein
MAVLDPLHPIQSAIIELLGREHPLSMHQLKERIVSEYQVKVSPQNLYRTVALLLTAQVLVRESGMLSLNRIWVSHTMRFSDLLKKNYFTGQSQATKFPEGAALAREFKAGSLLQLDPLWTDVLVELGEKTKSKKLYAFNSHPWYSIGMPDTEQRVMEGLTSRGLELFMLYGNDTFLDRYGKRLIEIDGFHSTCSVNHDLPREGYALWVGGPYIIEVNFPPLIARQFKFFFDSIQAIEQLDIELFSNLFKLKGRCSLKVSKSPERARALKAKLQRHF